MTERNPPETQEEFAVRVATETEALNKEILENGMSEEDARAKLELLSEKHQFEQEYHAVIPTLEEYEITKSAMDYKPAVRNVALPEENSDAQAGEQAAQPTPPEPAIEAQIEESAHVSPQVAPEVAIEAVSAPAETQESASSNKTEMLINRINMIDYVDRERQRAVRELEGKKRGNEMIPGLRVSADEIEALLKELGTDERILNSEELKRKRSLETSLKGIIEAEAEAKAYLNKADLEIGGNIEIVANDFKNLDEDLQQAIRVGDKAVLDKYNVNMWAAERIMRELSARDWQENQMKRKKAEEQTTWKDIAGAVGTSELALFSGDEIRKVLDERGITEANVGLGLTKLVEQLKADESPRRAPAQAKAVDPTARVFTVASGFGSTLDAKRDPSAGDSSAGEASAVSHESLMRGTWEEVDKLMSDPDENIRALASAEWARREQAALRYSLEKKTRGALENTLETIESGHGDTVPAKWLREFQEVPAVAKFLKQQNVSLALDSKMHAEEDVGSTQHPDVIEPKTGYLEKLERNSARAQLELDALNVPEGKATDTEPVDIPLEILPALPIVEAASEPEPLIARNFNPTPPEVPELVPIDQTPKAEPTASEQPAASESTPALPEVARAQSQEEQEADRDWYFVNYNDKPVRVLGTDGKVEEDWVARGFAAGTTTAAVITLRRQLADGNFEDKKVPLTDIDNWNLFEVPAAPATPENAESISAPAEVLSEGRALVAIGEAKKIDPETDLDGRVAEALEGKFGINQEMIKQIDGFKDLSPGQQLLTLKNLESMALEDVKKDAAVQQKEEWAKKGIWKRIGLSMVTLGMSPDIRVAELEKELAAKQRGGDAADPERIKILAKNLAALGELTKVAKAGPEVEAKAGGELSIKYISRKDVFGELDAGHLTPENLATMERFNAAADTYAKFPHEWGYETAKPGLLERFKQDRRDYNQAKAEYDFARQDMAATYVAKFTERGDKDPVQSAMIAMNKVDERMQLDQLFNTHPDAEDALLKVEDQSVIRTAAKEFWKKKGSFMVYGAAARAAAVAISGGVMLPIIAVVGGGVGYGIGQAEGKKLMKAKRADGRMGEEDVREEVEYAVFRKDANGKEIVDEKTGEKVIERVETRMIREFTDANFFVKRIDRLSNKLEQSTDDAERELLEKKIAQTVALMKEKNERGMINFGGSSLEVGDERKGNTIANRLSFIQAMSKGEIETAVDKVALEAEMARITGYRQETIEDVRTSEIRKMALKSGLIRGGFALAGGALVQGAHELFHGSTPAGALTTAQGGVTVPHSPEAGISQEAVAVAKRDGWISEVVRHAQQDPKFNKDYMENIVGALGRNPAVGLSDTELNALQATDGIPAREAAHQALLKAIEFSPNGKVPDEEIAKIMLANNIPTSIQEAATALANETANSSGEAATATYVVKTGDNLTHIIKEHIAGMKNLTPAQQENAIQNLLSKMSRADMEAIGITDPNHITPGQSIQIDKINDLLGSERLMSINGESIINHAQNLGKVSSVGSTGGVASEAAQSVRTSPAGGGFGEVREFVGTLSASDTASIEATLGRSISATESSVLHSIKGLSELADSDAAKNNINEALAHLGQEMRATNGVPLTAEQMMFILHQHNALDAQIRLPEVAHVAPATVQTMPSSVTTAPVVESAPLPLSPEANIANAHSISEMAAYIKRAPSADESFTLTNLLELEQNTKMNPGLSADIAAAKVEMLNAMKLAKGELRPLAMYKILETHHLEAKVIVSPDAGGELLMYMETHKR